jgi:hypothetical protein
VTGLPATAASAEASPVDALGRLDTLAGARLADLVSSLRAGSRPTVAGAKRAPQNHCHKGSRIMKATVNLRALVSIKSART